MKSVDTIQEVKILPRVHDWHDPEQRAWENAEAASPTPSRARHIVSMPVDPTAPDFAERINAVSPDTVEGLRSQVPPEGIADKRLRDGQQGDLF